MHTYMHKYMDLYMHAYTYRLMYVCLYTYINAYIHIVYIHASESYNSDVKPMALHDQKVPLHLILIVLT